MEHSVLIIAFYSWDLGCFHGNSSKKASQQQHQMDGNSNFSISENENRSVQRTEPVANHQSENRQLLLVGNVLHLIFGIPEAIIWAVWGVVLCITIIGIPFGLQWASRKKTKVYKSFKNSRMGDSIRHFSR